MTKFVVLNQITYQDYHLLVTALNQNGHLYTFVCLGGQGSAKKQTGKKLEIGYVIEVQALSENKKLNKLYLKEFEVVFTPKEIRNNYNIWCVLNFILEVTQRTATEKDLNSIEWELLKVSNTIDFDYEVLVKYIFLLEDIAKNTIDKIFTSHLCQLYVVKVMLLQGILPNLTKCSVCSSPLTAINVAHFEGHDFYCNQCAPVRSVAVQYWKFLVFSKEIKFSQLINMSFTAWQLIENSVIDQIFEQNFSLLGLSKSSLRSYTLISK